MSGAAVTGLGAVSGLGIGVSALWQGLCAGTQAPRRYPALAAAGLGLGPVAKVLLPADSALLDGAPDDGRALLDGRPRAMAMALLAAQEALRDGGLALSASERPKALRLGVVVGTTLGEKAPWVQQLRARWGAAAAGVDASSGVAAPARAVARACGASCLRVVSVACASSNAALGAALSWIRAEVCDVVLCGGVDTLSEFVLSGFYALRAHDREPCRPFDRSRGGLNLGEGAAFLLLESLEHARARGQRVRAELSGYGCSCDANHMTGPDRQGRGAARAMAVALQDAGVSPQELELVSAHGTATVFNDLMEARGLAAVLGADSARVPVSSIKGSLGHTLGAAGAIEAVMVVRALEEQLCPPTAGYRERDADIQLDIVAGAPRALPLRAALSTSSGFGGVNAALVLRQAGSERAAPPVRRAAGEVPCAIVAAGALFPRSDQPLRSLLPDSSPPDLAGQLMRMDRLCALSVCAAERAVAGLWNPRERPPPPASLPSARMGLLLGSSHGCHKTDEEYLRTLLDGQPSPRLFSYTLPSSPLGELSILYQLRGPSVAIVSGRTAGLEALAEAQTLLREARVEACLVIAAEVAAPAVAAMPATAEDELIDGAVALLLMRADAPRLAPQVPLGYLLGTGSQYRAAEPGLALAGARHEALAAAALPADTPVAVLADEATCRWLPSELQAAAASTSRQGAVAALQAMLTAATGEAARVLILCGDADGQAAAALWSRGP